MSMLNKSCADFLQELSGKDPVPGGGGAAALCGAIGIALSNMVGNLTLGKKAYAQVEPEVEAMIKTGNELMLKLENLVDRDAMVFEPLSKAYGLSRENEEQIIYRTQKLEEYSKEASLVPLEIMKASLAGIKINVRMGEVGNRMAISDIACGVAFLNAAIVAASMNVLINLNSINDKEFVDLITKEMNVILKEGSEITNDTIKNITERIRK